MKKNLSRKIKEAIETSLGDILNEAYVVEAKRYNLRTDLLSDATKKAQQQELDGFVAALNRVSAELEGADREDANNKASNFRSLKEDEVHCMNAAFLRALYFENISSWQKWKWYHLNPMQPDQLQQMLFQTLSDLQSLFLMLYQCHLV